MKHIDTKCPEEKKARKDYPDAGGKPVTAGEKLEATWRELLDLSHKMDADELRASQLKAILMNGMKNSACLQTKEGKVLATWMSGAEKAVTDWQGLCTKYKVSKKDIDDYTTIKRASRTFSIEEA